MIDINRINELSKKQKTVGLTNEEKIEQQNLRQAYRDAYLKNLKTQHDNITIIDKDLQKK